MKFCLIGEKLSHSYSKEIHNLCGLNYTLKEISRCGVHDFVKNSDYLGFNVTIPYKKDVMPFLDVISSEATSVGAVNTVCNKNGKLFGYNTDVGGFLYMVERKGVSLEGKNVLILGTGGASKAVYYAVKSKNAKSVNFVGRTSPINYENCYELQDTQIIINTTPVGMYPNVNERVIDLSKFNRLIAVFDLIYNPQKTLLIKDALSLGLVCSNGLSMLIEQALIAENLWLDKTHDSSKTEEIIKSISKSKLNIVLWGMPSCGKTTIGKALAEKLNREFVDLDDEITKRNGLSPSEIIKTYGEEEFRKIESKILNEVAIKSGLIISLGGGAVIKEENRCVISQNSVTVYVKRNLDLLVLDNRPLSIEKGVETLYNERRKFYETADFCVENNDSVDVAVEEIIKKYEIVSDKWA